MTAAEDIDTYEYRGYIRRIAPKHLLTFDYTNHCGERALRSCDPITVWFGSTEWHREAQWFLRAIDMERGAMRDFAMRDMSNIRNTPRDLDSPVEMQR